MDKIDINHPYILKSCQCYDYLLTNALTRFNRIEIFYRRLIDRFAIQRSEDKKMGLMNVSKRSHACQSIVHQDLMTERYKPYNWRLRAAWLYDKGSKLRLSY